MADFTTQKYTPTIIISENVSHASVQNISTVDTFSVVDSVPQSVTYYLMRWLDTDCISTPTYRTWVVTSSPDPSGAHYTGAKCGATAIAGAVIAATWTA